LITLYLINGDLIHILKYLCETLAKNLKFKVKYFFGTLIFGKNWK